MEYLIDIPGRLHSVAVEKHIAGTDLIYDDFLKTTLNILNLENITDVKVQDNKFQFLNIQGLVLKEISIASGTQKQSDWNLTDSTQVDFIKNKPTVYNKLEVDDKLTTKQDTIDDIATIRSGAQEGATAYQKPETGIPATDLASAVQVSLGKADTALQEHQSLAGLVNTGNYNTVSKKIELKHDNTVLAEIDATAFIKDGMVSSVTINNGYLVITFNTDAGKEPISIALTDIFNPANYYTKSQVDNALSDKLDASGSNYGVYNGALKISGLQDQDGAEYIRNGMHLLQGLKIYYYDYETIITGKDIVVHSKGEPEDGSVSLRELARAVDDKANTSDLAPVATSGNYDDLTGRPAVDNTPTPNSNNLVKSGGVYGTTPSITNTDAESDLDFSDEGGNVLLRLSGGHIKTKNFNSAEPTDLMFLADVSACKYSGNLMHISLDDTNECLTALFSQRPNSIYDITFFDNLRTLHNTYGACFSCYVYVESLANVTNTYANEFQAAKSWLRWNFHTYNNHVYNEDTSIKSDYDLGITRLLTMIGNDKDCLDHELRGNMWELSLANAQYVRDNATHSSYIFFAKDAFSPSTGNYYFSEEQKTFVFNNGF